MKKNIIILVLIFLIIVLSFTFFIREAMNLNKLNKLNQSMLQKERSYEITLVDFIVTYDRLFKKYQELYGNYQEQAILLTEQEANNEIGDWEYFKITGYSINDVAQGTTDIVRAGLSLNDPAVSKLPIIAVDPNVVPLYSIVEIEGLGAFIALDTGGSIKGNHIEILFDSKEKATNFGVTKLRIRGIK